MKELQKLEYLYLGFTGITDAGLKELTAMKGLRERDIGRTPTTAAGMRQLKDLPNLKALITNGTNVDALAPMQLRREMPQVRIIQ